MRIVLSFKYMLLAEELLKIDKCSLKRLDKEKAIQKVRK